MDAVSIAAPAPSSAVTKASAAGTTAPTKAKAIAAIKPIVLQKAIAPRGALKRLAEEVTTSMAVTPHTIIAPVISPWIARYAIMEAHTTPLNI